MVILAGVQLLFERRGVAHERGMDGVAVTQGIALLEQQRRE